MFDKIKNTCNADVVVAGGGTAGCAAAISCAMAGADTLLIEKNSFLGGSCTGGQVTPMMCNRVEGNIDNSSINVLIKKRLKKQGFALDDGYGNDGWFNPEMMKFVLEEVCSETGVRILYDSEIIDLEIENSRIKNIIIHNCSGLQKINAKVFIDCTGDCDLGYLSGAECLCGNEKGENQAVSLRFMVGGIDIQKLINFIKEAGEACILELPLFEMASEWNIDTPLSNIFKKAVNSGVLKFEDTVYFQAFAVPGMSGVLSFNCPEILNVNVFDAQEHSKALIKGREMIKRLFAFLKNNFPGFEDSFIISVSNMLGVRESRRLKGLYVLSEKDFLFRNKFEDGIAKTSYSIDIHGQMDEKNFEIAQMKKGEYVEIPFRCLVSADIENLLAAGRCISSTFIAQSAARIQPTCRETGEAAGIAAALSAKEGICVQSLDGRMVRLEMENRMKKLL